jgi:thiamine-monophosphate kinase
MRPEDRFVERLRRLLPASERIAVGPGDDAAVVRVESEDRELTTDLVVEGVDFLPETDPESVGRRALAVNLSDLAAMGARPEFFLLSIGFSAEKGEDFPLAVARGALSRARPLGVDLAVEATSRAAHRRSSPSLSGARGEPAGAPIGRVGRRRALRLRVSRPRRRRTLSGSRSLER